MTTQTQATSVTTSTEVQAPIEHAFRMYTEGIGTWWNPGHHILQAELAEMVSTRESAATSSTAAPTAASAAGAGYSPTTRRTGTASAGISA